MKKKEEKGAYWRLMDLLHEHEEKLAELNAELQRLEFQKEQLGAEAVDAFLKKSSGYREKETAIRDNLIATEAKKREIGYMQKAMEKTEEQAEEEKKKEPYRIRAKYIDAYKAALKALYKKLLEAEARRLQNEARREIGRLGIHYAAYRYVPLPGFWPVLLPGDGEGLRKHGVLDRFEQGCKESGIEL